MIGKKLAFYSLFIFASLLLAGISTADNETNGTLRIYSTPPGALVYINNVFAGSTNFQTQLPEGSYSVKLTKAGFEDFLTTAYITSGQTTIISAVLTSLNQTNGTLRVRSTPFGASVYIDDAYAGLTTYTSSLAAGTYQIKLTKAGYADFLTTAYISGGQTTVISASMTLLNQTNGTLRVYSTPTDASVYINDVFAGTTTYSASLSAGAYQVKITKAGYADFLTTAYISGGQTTVISASMTLLNQTNGTLRVYSTPTDASVYINDVFAGTTTLTTSLPAGNYSIRLNRTGYQDFLTTAYISGGQTTIISASMTQINATNNQTNGTLAVDAIPNGAAVYVNNVYVGQSIYTGSFAPGTYSIKLTKAGYQDHYTTAYISTSMTTTIVATLSPANSQNGTLAIDTTPQGASVYINNVLSGTTLFSTSFAPGTYSIKLTKAGYQDHYTTAYISASMTTTIVATLSPINSQNGTLAIDANPNGAAVYVNNVYMGATVYTGSFAPGTYSIKLTKAGYQDYYTTAYISASMTTTIVANLAPVQNQMNITLRIDSTPSRASVYIDDVYAGQTLYSALIPEGTHSIKLTKAGYQDYLTTAYVRANQVTTIAATLLLQNGTIDGTSGTAGGSPSASEISKKKTTPQKTRSKAVVLAKSKSISKNSADS